MSLDDATATSAAAALAGPARGFAWIACGWGLLRRRAGLWLGMTALYFVLALALKRIPFLGNFVLILISPVALAGALLVARALKRGEPLPEPAVAPDHRGLRRVVYVALRHPAHALFQEAMGDLDRALTLIIVCIVTLGLAVAVAIPELILTGGSVISGLATAPLAAAAGFRPTLVLAMLAVAALYVLLAMALLYLVPLTLFGARLAIPAVIESFRTCIAHAAAVAAFVAPYFVIVVLIVAVFGTWHVLGYSLVFTLGLVALPAFVAGLYCSYEALFEPAETAAPAPPGGSAPPPSA